MGFVLLLALCEWFRFNFHSETSKRVLNYCVKLFLVISRCARKIFQSFMMVTDIYSECLFLVIASLSPLENLSLCLRNWYEHRRRSSAFISVIFFFFFVSKTFHLPSILSDVYNIQAELSDHLFIRVHEWLWARWWVQKYILYQFSLGVCLYVNICELLNVSISDFGTIYVTLEEFSYVVPPELRWKPLIFFRIDTNTVPHKRPQVRCIIAT